MYKVYMDGRIGYIQNVHIYMYIYRERERDRYIDRYTTCICGYIYAYQIKRDNAMCIKS